jgi:hypothetical protein
MRFISFNSLFYGKTTLRSVYSRENKFAIVLMNARKLKNKFFVNYFPIKV